MIIYLEIYKIKYILNLIRFIFVLRVSCKDVIL